MTPPTQTLGEGTYVKVQFKNSEEFIRIFSRLSIPGLIEAKDLHCTILYADNERPVVANVKPMLLNKAIELKRTSFSLFGEHHDALVVKFSNALLVAEHQRIVKEFDLKHSYPVYQPHLTLTYSWPKDGDVTEILMPKLPDLIVEDETAEPIKKDWADKLKLY